MHACMLHHVQVFAIPWTEASQTPLSMEFSRQAYWSGLLFPTQRDLPDSGTEWASLVYPALADKFLPLYHLGKIMQRKFQPELNCVLSFLKVIDEDQNCVLVTWKLAKASFPLIFSFCSHFNFLPQLFSVHWMKFTWILEN